MALTIGQVAAAADVNIQTIRYKIALHPSWTMVARLRQS